MRLTENLHLVGGGSWSGFGLSPGPDSHTYLIECGSDEFVLVDTGSGVPGSFEAIAGHVKDAGFSLRQIVAILLTHMHGDHIGGATRIAEATGADVYASAITAGVLETGDEGTSCVSLARDAGVYPPDYRLTPLTGVRAVASGSVLRFGDATFEVIETPGHCSGHLSFLLRIGTRRDLIAGDAVFWRGRVIMQPIPDCDPYAAARSIERLAELENLSGLFSGHGAITVSGANRHLNEAASHVRALRIPPSL